MGCIHFHQASCSHYTISFWISSFNLKLGKFSLKEIRYFSALSFNKEFKDSSNLSIESVNTILKSNLTTGYFLSQSQWSYRYKPRSAAFSSTVPHPTFHLLSLTSHLTLLSSGFLNATAEGSQSPF